MFEQSFNVRRKLIRSTGRQKVSFPWFVLQKLMGNVLLHLQDDQRLDINCTQLVNSEVRTMSKFTNLSL